MAKEIKLRKVEPHNMAMEGPTKEDLMPRIFIKFEDLPEAKEWENEEKYKIVYVGKQRMKDEHGVEIMVEKIGGAHAKERMSRRNAKKK